MNLEYAELVLKHPKCKMVKLNIGYPVYLYIDKKGAGFARFSDYIYSLSAFQKMAFFDPRLTLLEMDEFYDMFDEILRSMTTLKVLPPTICVELE